MTLLPIYKPATRCRSDAILTSLRRHDPGSGDEKCVARSPDPAPGLLCSGFHASALASRCASGIGKAVSVHRRRFLASARRGRPGRREWDIIRCCATRGLTWLRFKPATVQNEPAACEHPGRRSAPVRLYSRVNDRADIARAAGADVLRNSTTRPARELATTDPRPDSHLIGRSHPRPRPAAAAAGDAPTICKWTMLVYHSAS